MRDMEENPEVQWFSPQKFACRMCGRRAEGELFGRQNQTFGLHCQKCADKRIAAAKRERVAGNV